MQQIIVGYDGSAGARAALVWATEEARLRGLSLLVVTVHDDLPSQVPPFQADDAGVDAEVVAAEIADGLLHDVVRERGNPAQVLVEACGDDDLLVVGTRGHGSLVAALLGSVSRACLHGAHCPVAVVHATAATPIVEPGAGPVVVGLDGSDSSRHALLRAAEEARLRDVALRAVHAVRVDPATGRPGMVPTLSELAAWGRELVRTELERAAVTAEAQVAPGHPGGALVRAAEGASLLVVGSRGRNPLAGLLLGSVSDHCAAHSQVPVLVVR